VKERSKFVESESDGCNCIELREESDVTSGL
jgi:hypothetical protein